MLTSLIALYHEYTEALKTPITQPPKLRRLLVIEEAQNVVRPRRLEDPASIGERMVLELRKFGVGLILLAHHWREVPEAVFKDVGTIVALSRNAVPDWFFKGMEPKKIVSLREMLVFRDGKLSVRPKPKPVKIPKTSKKDDASSPKLLEVAEPKEQLPKPRIRCQKCGREFEELFEGRCKDCIVSEDGIFEDIEPSEDIFDDD